MGEQISSRRAKYRNSHNCCFDVSWPVDHTSIMQFSFELDTTVWRNNLALANHSCVPNAAYYKMWSRGTIIIAVYALKNIPAGSYVHFDYWPEDENAEYGGFDDEACQCGNENCRYNIL